MTTRVILAALLLAGCATGPVARRPDASPRSSPSPRPDEVPPVATSPEEPPYRAALRRFLDAARAGDFTAVHATLSRRWRDRYTVERLARDFRQEPLAGERVERAWQALVSNGPGAWQHSADRASLGLTAGARLDVVLEPDGSWRVDALETELVKGP